MALIEPCPAGSPVPGGGPVGFSRNLLSSPSVAPSSLNTPASCGWSPLLVKSTVPPAKSVGTPNAYSVNPISASADGAAKFDSSAAVTSKGATMSLVL
jgi:hypothetical protein